MKKEDNYLHISANLKFRYLRVKYQGNYTKARNIDIIVNIFYHHWQFTFIPVVVLLLLLNTYKCIEKLFTSALPLYILGFATNIGRQNHVGKYSHHHPNVL